MTIPEQGGVRQASQAQDRIAVVGPCASGKSTLARELQKVGYDVRQPAQEHSYVPYMWQRLAKPDILIYLDVNFDQLSKRHPHSHGDESRLIEQRARLHHAAVHCDLYLDTSDLTPDQVKERVLRFLAQR